ncbi:hypothetical protein KAH81_08510, partial [bacterium]|nr:hypothetical protein [bacterium]
MHLPLTSIIKSIPKIKKLPLWAIGAMWIEWYLYQFSFQIHNPPCNSLLTDLHPDKINAGTEGGCGLP